MTMTSDQTVEVLRAAGEPTRLRILALLAREELAVLELTRILGQSQPRVSRHLKLLWPPASSSAFPTAPGCSTAWPAPARRATWSTRRWR